MNTIPRKLAALFAIAAIAFTALLATAAGAQASVVPSSSAANFTVFNGTGRPIDVVVFPDGGVPIRKTLDVRESWKLSADFGQHNEITVRYVGDPNVAFLGHFDYNKGEFHHTDVVHASVPYFMQTKGSGAGIYLQEPR